MNNLSGSGSPLFSNERWLIDDDFEQPVVPAILRDDQGNEELDGLLPRTALEDNLVVIIPEWTVTPGRSNTVHLGWRVAGSPFEEVASFDFPDPIPPGDKTVNVPKALLLEGTYELSYKISVLGNHSSESLKKTVTIDLTPPDGHQKPRAVTFPDELSGVITEDYLSREGGVECTVPRFFGLKARDVATYFWTDTNLPPDGETPQGEVQFTQDDVDNNRLILPVTAQAIRQAGQGTRYLYYTLRDLVGNESPRSVLSPIEVDLTPPPQNLKPARVPLSSRGLIDRQHAREGATNEGGVTVEIDAYDNASADQLVVIDWNGTALAELPVNPNRFPLRAFVPWLTLTARGLGPLTVQVDYRVRRGRAFTPSPGPVFVPADFTIAGQDHPNAPAVLNATLEKLEVRGQNSDTANTLTAADFGLPASATVALYQNPQPGERLQVFWGRSSTLVDTYTVQSGDVAGQPVRFGIPWALIEPDLINPALPVFYTTDNGVNQQASRITDVNVNIEVIDGLKEPFFPHADIYGYLNCGSVPKLWEGVTVKIDADPHFSQGDRVEMVWQGCDSLNGSNPIPGVTDTFSKVLSAGEAQNGFEIVVLPFETLIAPMVDNGSATAHYTLYKSSGAIGRSHEEFVKITRTYPSGEVCGPETGLCDVNADK